MPPLVQCDDLNDCGYLDLLSTIQSILNFLIYFAGIVAVIMFVWAGVLYLTSGGNSAKVSKAHSIMFNTVVGFIIVLSAWLIISTILAVFGVTGTPLGAIIN